tara:strand:+ start:345 stop:527 length:183 start_codon:yes stop_codon:yes gene_type:complete
LFKGATILSTPVIVPFAEVPIVTSSVKVALLAITPKPTPSNKLPSVVFSTLLFFNTIRIV